MEDSLIHLPCPEVYIEAFTGKKRNNLIGRRNHCHNSDLLTPHSQETETNTNANAKTESAVTMYLQQSQTVDIGPSRNDECIVNDDDKPRHKTSDDFCHNRVKDKDNVVHLTNLNASRWNEGKIRNVLLQINPYWNEKKITIYILQHETKGLLTASIEFKSREYSEKALELIESNFNLFVHHRNIVSNSNSPVPRMNMTTVEPIHHVTGIKLKFIKPNLLTNHVFSCYGQTIIPLQFDIKSIISNYYQLHCTVATKLEYYQNRKLLNDIPTTHDIESYLLSCEYPPICSCSNEFSKKLILTVYFPFITLCIVHESERYYFYISGNLLSLYQFKARQNKYIPIVRRSVSPSCLSGLLYIDVLALIDNTGYYTFYDSMNSNFECDLYRQIAHDLNENDITPFNLVTMKLPNGDSQLDRCVICLNMINEFEFTRISSCRHLFHYNCIKSLLQFNYNAMNQQIWDQHLNCYVASNYAHCPLCRRKFTAIQSRISNQQNRPTVQFINVTDISLMEDRDECIGNVNTTNTHNNNNNNDMDSYEQRSSQETSSMNHDDDMETSVSDDDDDDDGVEEREEDDLDLDLEEDQDEYNEDANSYYESFEDD